VCRIRASITFVVGFRVVRCVPTDVAVADRTWQLTSVYGAAGNRLPRSDRLHYVSGPQLPTKDTSVNVTSSRRGTRTTSNG
jgi:hypothetical protein